jgi:hypothetical protein
MHKIMLKIVVCSLFVVGLVGCSTTSMIKTTDQLYIENVSLTLTESVKPDIEYYKEEEVQKIFEDTFIKHLKEENLLTLDNTQNSLSIEITYHRQFAGDGTPFPSDSLRGPRIGYTIIVKDGSKVLTQENRSGLEYVGNMLMKLKIGSYSMRDKSDEDALIEGVAEMIAEDIENLEKP